MELYNKLKSSRKKLNLTRKEVASDLNITIQAVAKYESVHKKAPPMNYVNYLVSRGIELNWLLKEDDENINETFKNITYQNHTSIDQSVISSLGKKTSNVDSKKITELEHQISNLSSNINDLYHLNTDLNQKLENHLEQYLQELKQAYEGRINDLKSFCEQQLHLKDETIEILKNMLSK